MKYAQLVAVMKNQVEDDDELMVVTADGTICEIKDVYREEDDDGDPTVWISVDEL